MPPTARPWFRLYSDILENEKIDNLRPLTLKYWLKLLALANVNSERGRLPPLKRIAYRLRISDSSAGAVVAELKAVGLIDSVDGALVMHDWDDWQKDRDVSVTKRRATSPDSVTREEKRLEKEIEQEKEGDVRAALGWTDKHDDEGFIQQYRQHYEKTTGLPIDGRKTLAAGRIEKEYGFEPCMRVAAALGWEKPPNYYVGALEDDRAGKPVGRNAVATQAPVSALAAIHAAYPSIKQWTDLEPGAGDGGLASVDGNDDPQRLEVRR